jgi:hypothetical protein
MVRFSENHGELTLIEFANRYCSSDAYVGAAEPNIGPLGWYFRGKKIVSALFADLLEYRNLSYADEILLTGSLLAVLCNAMLTQCIF